ncbi:MAG TPA: type II toxin-antitoxin system RelE/ParE family toxin [Sphingomicrobium sp.]|nr:type II toxin-antitoxin system RelE/ParE family toxin [Sphingomicrobium sp.]
MPTYRLEFLPVALKEWRKLGATVRNQFAKKLHERLIEPRIASARLSEFPDCYKIKLRKAGYRLVYRVDDDRIVVIVIAVGRRERSEVYRTTAKRVG